MMKENGTAPSIPPYEHGKHGYYRYHNGYNFRPIDIVNGKLVALNAALVREREDFRAGITTFSPGEPSKKQGIHRGNKELTRVA